MLFPFLPGGVRLPQRLDLPDAEDLSSDELAELSTSGALATGIAAARALASRKDSRAFEVLVEGLASRHFRYASLEGLRWLGDSRAQKPVSQVMQRAFLGVFERTQAAGVLTVLGDPAGPKHLLERLARRRRDDDRGLAIEISAEIGLHEAIAEIERAAMDKADIFRGAALKALAKLDPRTFEALLCGIARDEAEDPDVRADVVEALVEMKGEQPRLALKSASRSSCAELAELTAKLLADR